MSDSLEGHTPSNDPPDSIEPQEEYTLEEILFQEEEQQSPPEDRTETAGIPVLPVSRLTPIVVPTRRLSHPEEHDVPFTVGNPWSDRWKTTELPHFRRSAWNVAEQSTQRMRQQPRRSSESQTLWTADLPLRGPRPGDQPQTQAQVQPGAPLPHGPPLPPPDPDVAPSTPPTDFEATFQALLINLRALGDLVGQTRRLLEGLAETIQSEIAAKVDKMGREDDAEEKD